MAFDNGKEFAKDKKNVNKHGAKTYLTRPYAPQDKGDIKQKRVNQKIRS